MQRARNTQIEVSGAWSVEQRTAGDQIAFACFFSGERSTQMEEGTHDKRRNRGKAGKNRWSQELAGLVQGVAWLPTTSGHLGDPILEGTSTRSPQLWPFANLFWGRVPLLKYTTEKFGTLVLNLSIGGPSQGLERLPCEMSNEHA